MTTRHLGIALISVAVFIGCAKEYSYERGDPPPVDPPPVPQPVKNRLISKRITEVPDWSYIDSFEYDSQNRCTRLYTNSRLLSLPDTSIYYYDFHYRGNETLPYKVTDSSHGADMLWLIEYDAQKRKIVDSIQYYSTNSRRVSYYSYSNNRITAITTHYQADTIVVKTRDTFDTDGNNCIRYVGYIDARGRIPDYWWEYSMTHDNKMNPISKLNIAKSPLFGGDWTTVGDFNALNRNNYITAAFNSSTSGPGGVQTFQYTYDADGDPVSANAKDNLNRSWFLRIKFYYNK